MQQIGTKIVSEMPDTAIIVGHQNYRSFRNSSPVDGVPVPELAMSQLPSSLRRRRRSPRSLMASRMRELTSSSASFCVVMELSGFIPCREPGRGPAELLRLRFRLGGRVEKKPMLAKLWKDSLRGRGSADVQVSPVSVSRAYFRS